MKKELKLGELISIQEYHKYHEGKPFVWKGDVSTTSYCLLQASGSVNVRLVIEASKTV